MFDYDRNMLLIELKNNNIIDIYENDKNNYYYCSKNIKLPLQKLIKDIYDYFIFNKLNKVSFENIYRYFL